MQGEIILFPVLAPHRADAVLASSEKKPQAKPRPRMTDPIFLRASRRGSRPQDDGRPRRS